MESGCIGMVHSSTTETIKKNLFTKRECVGITEDTFLITFNEKIDFLPGQFVMIGVDSHGLTRKPFTIGKFQDNLAISVKTVGEGSKYIVETTTPLEVIGPLGKPFIPSSSNGVAVVAPSCIVEGLHLSEHFDIPLHVCSKTPLNKDFISAMSNDKMEFHIGDNAYLQLLNQLKFEKYDWVFITGSKMMEKIGIAALSDTSGKVVYVSYNEYMGCGIGACKSCAVMTKNGIKHVCSDGPIFRGDEICFQN